MKLEQGQSAYGRWVRAAQEPQKTRRKLGPKRLQNRSKYGRAKAKGK